MISRALLTEPWVSKDSLASTSAYGKQNGKTLDEQVEATLDRLLVEFGKEILKIIPG
jgi:transaldolase